MNGFLGERISQCFSKIFSSAFQRHRHPITVGMSAEKPVTNEKKVENGIDLNYVIDLWLMSSSTKHKRSTNSTYKTVADRHIRPVLGSITVNEITSVVLTEFIRDKACGSGEERALAPSTVCSIITVLRSVLRYAESMGCVVKGIDVLDRPKLLTGETEILTTPAQKQLEATLLQELDFEKLGVLVCLYSGLRIGEICALKWGDISIDTGVLTVKRTVQRIKNSEQAVLEGGSKTILVFDAPKSKTSCRAIPLPTFLVELLREKQCDADCYLLTGDPVVFIEPRTFQNRFKRILKQASLPDMNFHALRHTFATNCIDLGVDPKTLSQILGHADVSVTLNTYVHPSLSKMRACMELLGNNRESVYCQNAE